jgi:NADH dehydrogenase (ubiquinone) 1 beta subcomplex subunit 8
VLSVFAYDPHNHVTLPFALKWFVGFAVAFTGMCFFFVYSWPGPIAVPRTYPYNGLEREIGGPNNSVYSILIPIANI